MRKIDHIVIHCAATPNGDARFTRDRIKQMHLENDWSDIGYHYVIECDGKVVEGRPEKVAGAHVSGHNANSIGVCMIGTDKFSDWQWDALAILVRRLCDKYRKAVVKGHRDFSPDLDGDGIVEKHEWVKICPGFDVATWLKRGGRPLPEHVL